MKKIVIFVLFPIFIIVNISCVKNEYEFYVKKVVLPKSSLEDYYRSEKTVFQFTQYLVDGCFDSAYGMLSKNARFKLNRDKFDTISQQFRKHFFKGNLFKNVGVGYWLSSPDTIANKKCVEGYIFGFEYKKFSNLFTGHRNNISIGVCSGGATITEFYFQESYKDQQVSMNWKSKKNDDFERIKIIKTYLNCTKIKEK